MSSFTDQWLGPKVIDKTVAVCKGLADIAKEIGCTQVQLAYAWCLANTEDVSTIIMGASKLEQVHANLGAIGVYRKWTKELEEKIETLIGNRPENRVSMVDYKPVLTGRQVAIAKL